RGLSNFAQACAPDRAMHRWRAGVVRHTAERPDRRVGGQSEACRTLLGAGAIRDRISVGQLLAVTKTVWDLAIFGAGSRLPRDPCAICGHPRHEAFIAPQCTKRT